MFEAKPWIPFNFCGTLNPPVNIYQPTLPHSRKLLRHLSSAEIKDLRAKIVRSRHHRQG